MCVCLCARARVCVCVCVRACVRACALRMVSLDKTWGFGNTLIIVITTIVMTDDSTVTIIEYGVI